MIVLKSDTETTPNKRVGCRAGRCFWFEPSGSNGWSVCLGVIVPIPPHTQTIRRNGL
jgi:hypothetical protein